MVTVWLIRILLLWLTIFDGFWMVNYGFWMVNHGNYGYCNPPLFRLMVNQQHLQASARRNAEAAKALQTLCRSLATGATAWRKDGI